MSTYGRPMTGEPEQVLVVGAGPTGLALTALLAFHGVRARLIDRNLDRAHESRALAIQPRTLEVLAGLGVTDELVRAGNRNVQVRMHAPGRVLSVPMFDLGLADTAYPFLLFLSQAETERILAENLHARGIAVERGAELTGLQRGPDAVTVTLRHAGGRVEELTVRYVVGCDGAHSTVRQLAGIAFEGAAYPQTFVLADLEADGPEPGTAHVFLSAAGMLFFFPLVTPASWRLLVMRPPHDPTPPDAAVSLAEVQTLCDAYTEGAVRLRDPVWMTNFRLHHRAAKHYRAGRVLLAGDAAHIHSPAGAQGMNTGIQDGANLAWKLAHTLHGTTPPSIVDTYAVEREPIGRKVLRMSDRAFTIATSTNPIVRFARTRLAPAVLPLALKAGNGRGLVFRTAAQLRISYRDSPLSAHGPGVVRRGIRAGDRLPDAPITIDGQASSLHALTATPTWHLLLCGPGWPATATDAVAGRAEVVAVHHLHGVGCAQALHRLEVQPGQRTLLLVRPDGHVGLHVTNSSTAITLLKSYIDIWLPRQLT
jgi:2-polyprenyl-6-methoxyphenol hydroxylase-like FAD-dependent oxidoreductase